MSWASATAWSAGQLAWMSASRRMRIDRSPTKPGNYLAAPYAHSIPNYRSKRRRGGAMAIEKQNRRVTLDELLAHAQECSRDLFQHLHTTLALRLADFHDLSRPTRRRSHYPTMVV